MAFKRHAAGVVAIQVLIMHRRSFRHVATNLMVVRHRKRVILALVDAFVIKLLLVFIIIEL